MKIGGTSCSIGFNEDLVLRYVVGSRYVTTNIHTATHTTVTGGGGYCSDIKSFLDEEGTSFSMRLTVSTTST